MSSLAITIPATLLLAGLLAALVVRAARRGEFDDWEGPAVRHAFDDDRTPELEGDTQEASDSSANVDTRRSSRRS